MSNYTCRLCGRRKDSRKEPWDYFADGVACEKCLRKLKEDRTNG